MPVTLLNSFSLCAVRLFCCAACLGFLPALQADETEPPIDRRALVQRHNPENSGIDPLCPLTIGNGSFAFTADVTGLQSFPEEYGQGIPLCTQSEWAWHSFPNPAGFTLPDAERDYDTYGRLVPYASRAGGPAGKWLRANPHRLGLGRIGLEFVKSDGTIAASTDVANVEQRLDLWSGNLSSSYTVDGVQVSVFSCCDPKADALAVRVHSDLIRNGRLKVGIRFGYGSGEFGKSPDDWDHPESHTTEILRKTANSASLKRVLDADSYYVQLTHLESCRFVERGRHWYELQPTGTADELEFVIRFSPTDNHTPLPSVDEVRSAAARSWEEFWLHGGAIELAGSTDRRALELERRIVLSQYLLAVQCAGNRPPQETGLTFNSWFGKSHLEMHWWHAVHFALWNRLEVLEKSLEWYQHVLPRARRTAQHQGYAGARWPKMVGPEGRESPSSVGVFLVWQQPHPIYYAELCYRQRGTVETLEKYRDIVFATADFMASYAHFVPKQDAFVLGPPLIPAQEHYDPRTTTNPTFELEYWFWALGNAQQWRDRLRLPDNEQWNQVRSRLAELPTANGVYETAAGKWVTTDHPSHLAALGVLPGRRVDPQLMLNTLLRVWDGWEWNKTWGWDYPMMAMTAARVGRPDLAVDALLLDKPKNRYLDNGHNYQDARLPIYLPGNGGLLTATAMMAAGWDDAPDQHAPGFPQDGSWHVRWENLHKMP